MCSFVPEDSICMFTVKNTINTMLETNNSSAAVGKQAFFALLAPLGVGTTVIVLERMD
jgi:hypothetical protein